MGTFLFSRSCAVEKPLAAGPAAGQPHVLSGGGSMVFDSPAPHPPPLAAWGAPSRVTRRELFDEAARNEKASWRSFKVRGATVPLNLQP